MASGLGGFAEGFAAGFLPAYKASAEAEINREETEFKAKWENFKTLRETHMKLQIEDTKWVNAAKTLVQDFGLPPGAIKPLRDRLAAGETIKDLRDSLEKSVTVFIPNAAPKPASTDEQMQGAGLTDKSATDVTLTRSGSTTGSTEGDADKNKQTETGSIWTPSGRAELRSSRTDRRIQEAAGGKDVYDQILKGYTSPTASMEGGRLVSMQTFDDPKKAAMYALQRTSGYLNADAAGKQTMLVNLERQFDKDSQPKTVVAAMLGVAMSTDEYKNGDAGVKTKILEGVASQFGDKAPTSIEGAALRNLESTDAYKNADPKGKNEMLTSLKEGLSNASGAKARILNENSTPEALSAGIAVARAQGNDAEVARLQTIFDAKVAATNNLDLTSKVEPTYVRGADGKLQRALVTEKGQLVDESRQLLTGVTRVPPEEITSIDKALGFLNTEIKLRGDKSAQLRAALQDSMDLVRMVQHPDGDSLLLSSTGFVGGVASTVKNLVNVADLTLEYIKEQTANGVIKPDENGVYPLGDADRAEITRRLRAAIVPAGGKLDQTLTRYYDFQNKMLDLAFRLGGIRGQSGNGLSNKDLELFRRLISGNSSGKSGFISNLQNLTSSLVREFDARQDQYNRNPIIDSIRDIAPQKDLSLMTSTLAQQFIQDGDAGGLKMLMWTRGFEGGIRVIAPQEVPQEAIKTGADGKVTADTSALIAGLKLSFGDYFSLAGRTYTVVKDPRTKKLTTVMIDGGR